MKQLFYMRKKIQTKIVVLGLEDRQIVHFSASLFYQFSTWHEKKKNQARQNPSVYAS